MIEAISLSLVASGGRLLEGDAFALCVAGGSDLSGDAIPDFVVSDATPDDSIDLWFVSGRDSTVLRRRSIAGDGWHRAIRKIGDADGNGFSDFAAWLEFPDGSERAEVVSGSDASVLRTFGADGVDDPVDPGCIWTEDVDEDGRADLLACGQRLGDTLSIVRRSGKDGTPIGRVDWEEIYEGCGRPNLAPLGDVDGDGRVDVAALLRDALGRTRMVWISGRTGSTIRSFDRAETNVWNVSLDGGADVDGDGRADVVLGSPWSFVQGGVAAVYSGASGTNLHTIRGSDALWPGRPSDEMSVLAGAFGEQVRFVSDVDGDESPDVLIGSPEWIGAAFVCCGRTGTVLRYFPGHRGELGRDGRDSGQYHVGRALDVAGDLDGDAVGDLLVASVPDRFSGFGCVRAFSGRTGALLLQVDRAFLVGQRPRTADHRSPPKPNQER